MPTPRRLWDSCTVIGYLAGETALAEQCSQIITQAEVGDLEILVSVMATIETSYLKGLDDQVAEAMIKEFFSRRYIIPVTIDVRTAAITRELVRKYRDEPNKIKPPDAVHLATAIQWEIPVIETTDPDLLQLDRQEGDPLITIRKPMYEGAKRFPGIC